MAKIHRLQLTKIEEAFDFMLGNNATFTLVSKETQKRYTFRIRKADFREKKEDQNPNAPLFVQFMNGTSNTTSFAFVGTIFQKNTYRYGKKSRVGFDSVVNKTFMWLFNTLLNGKTDNFDKVEFWHEGNCGQCNRKLTDPISIVRGFGPVCRPLDAESRKIAHREATLKGLFELFAKKSV